MGEDGGGGWWGKMVREDGQHRCEHVPQQSQFLELDVISARTVFIYLRRESYLYSAALCREANKGCSIENLNFINVCLRLSCESPAV